MRRQIKDAIKTLVQTATGVAEVYTYNPKLKINFPVVVVNLRQAEEDRASSPAKQGKKRVEFVAQLEIQSIDTTPDSSGQLAFDDVLDAIDVALRSDYTLGGVALASAIKYIKTVVAPPVKVNGETVVLGAIKTFDVTVQITA